MTVECNWDLAFKQRGECRRRDRDIAKQRDVRNIDKADPCLSLLFIGDLERVALFVDARALRLDDQWERLVRRHRYWARGEGRSAQRTHFVWQAHRDEGAAGALGAIFQRWWNAALGADQAQPADGVARSGSQGLVEHDTHALAALGIVDRAFLDPIAMLFEQEGL